MNDQPATAALTPRALFDRAVSHHREGRLEEAAADYRALLAGSPRSATAWTNFGSLLRRQSHFLEAIAAHRKSLEIKPDNDSALLNLSNALCDAGFAEEAIGIRTELLAKDPDNLDRIRDLAVAYRGCWRNQDAVDLVDAAEQRLGKSEPLRLQRSLAHLMLGNYAQGFADFEYRYSGDEVALPTNAPWPRWSGEDLKGKRLVILPEQGFGDAILMSRFLPRLREMGPAEVAMVTKPPLQRLFARLDGVDRLIPAARKSDKFDYYTPNMSLPHLIGLPDGAPPPLPNLNIPADSRERAKAMVRPFGDRFKIGVVWTGSLTYRANHRRSTGPESFLGLATVPGVQLFSLYKGDAHKDFLAGGMAGLILDACGNDRDFADSAALIDEMDLLITTDTAVVHIAASLGKPVWNLLTWEGFWLYGSGETTPWYPSMRLFRQRANADWDELFTRVEAELRAHLELA